MNYSHRHIALLFFSLCISLLVGCAGLSKIDKGEIDVKDNFTVKVDQPWNRFSYALGSKAISWTQDGLYVDRLQFYVGVEDDSEIENSMSGSKEQRPLKFKKTMSTHELAQVFQNVLTRDGSVFNLTKLDPAMFLGVSGFRMEYGLVRKDDDVRMRGLVYGCIKQNKLYLMHYTAPRLVFYERHIASVESMAASARLKP
jgi:hypothetical protein